MELRDRPSVLRRGAAPPDERKTALFLAGACAIHFAILGLFLFRIAPHREFTIAGAPGPLTRARLVRLSPLAGLPTAKPATPEALKAKPKPALLKKYRPGEKIVSRPERAPVKGPTKEVEIREMSKDESKSEGSLAPSWWSADSSRGAGIGVDGDFKFAYYLSALRSKIAARWDPPSGMEFRPYPYRAVLYFRVQRDGRVAAIAVENSSGFPFFDQTAMRALQKASPLPPLPEGYKDQYLGVHFAFELMQ